MADTKTTANDEFAGSVLGAYPKYETVVIFFGDGTSHVAQIATADKTRPFTDPKDRK